jgi:hypothetical protein
MSPYLKKVSGAGLIIIGSFFLVTATASINVPVDISGPFNFWPPPLLPVLVALFDLIPLAGIVLGLRLLKLSHRTGLSLLLFLALLTITLGLRNYLNSPPAEGRNDTDLVAAPLYWQLSVLLISAGYVAVGSYCLRLRRVASEK